MAEDASTASVFLAVMDGHGEVGDKVAQVDELLEDTEEFFSFRAVGGWIRDFCSKRLYGLRAVTLKCTEGRVLMEQEGESRDSNREHSVWLQNIICVVQTIESDQNL